MSASWESATKRQYRDDGNLAARQAMFDWLTASTPLPSPLSDMSTLAGKRVIDVGCGNGRFLALARQNGAVAFGSDLSIGMVRSASALADAPVFQCDAHRLAIANGSVDVLLALWMIYHLDDRPAAMSEFARVLAPGGQLVAATNSGQIGQLDEFVINAITKQFDRRVDHWHAPISFTSDNGHEVLSHAFADVSTHHFGNVFTVTDVDVLVRYVASLTDALIAEHPDVDVDLMLHEVGQMAADLIDDAGAVMIERTGTVFIGHR